MKYGSYFNWELAYPALEQGLYFVILACFCMMLSCFKLTFQHDTDKYLVEKFASVIVDPTSSNLWKGAFFGLKHIQSVVLVLLFVSGSDDINSLENLGYMLFFVVYTTYEGLYRKTSKFLTVFISFVISG